MKNPGATARVPVSASGPWHIHIGPWRFTFDPEFGGIRNIRFGAHEVLRAVYGAVRLEHWQTVAPRVSKVMFEQDPAHARLTFDVACRQDEAAFTWRGEVVAHASGTLTFTFDGRADAPFKRNRIGLCVLHAGRCAGQPCVVEHSDGTIERGHFPELIPPHQPFKDIAKVSRAVAPSLWADVRFDGDVFEMEDQRNWTDASFKTYSTPLELPFPVPMHAGDTVRQSVTLSMRGSVTNGPSAVQTDEIYFVEVDEQRVTRLPRIGLQMSDEPRALSSEQARLLRALRLAHLRVDLFCAAPRFNDRLVQASNQAGQLGVSLEAVAHVTDDAERELHHLAEAVRRVAPPVATWLVVPPGVGVITAQLAELAREHLRPASPGARIGGGTDGCFVDINRDRPPVHLLDAICYSMSPQVHATDDATVMQNLAGQAATVQSARQFTGGKPLHVTPVTLRPRFNAHVGRPLPDEPGRPPRDYDPRQSAAFGAAWTLGSIAGLAAAGADSVTCCQTIGLRGVIADGDFEGVYPVYHVLAEIGAFAGGNLHAVKVSSPDRLVALAMSQGQERRLLLANITPEPVRVRISTGSKAAVELSPWQIHVLSY